MKKHYNSLNEQQIKAIEHYLGPCMVYAGPGSGKTTVITHRIAHLITAYGINPNHILVITFTKAAAEEMKNRFEQLFKDEKIKGKVCFGTFHSVFFRMIRSFYGYELGSIINDSEKFYVIKNIGKTLGIEHADDEEFIRDILLEISLYYSDYLNRELFQSQIMNTNDFMRVISCYENYKKDHHKIDFDDMLIKCYELLLNHPKVLERFRGQYQHILIDEFQDINQIQYEIIKLLGGPNQNLFVVGDDDQSIYSFRGGKPEFILEFEKHYPKASKVIIATNYRSQENIIIASNALISRNQVRVPKEIIAFHKPQQEIVYLTPKDRGEENRNINEIIKACTDEGVSYSEIAIIYRTNILAAGIVNELLESQIPYYCKDQVYNLYEHWVSKDILTYLSCSYQLLDQRAFATIINKPSRYISKKAMEDASGYHKDFITSLKIKGGLVSYQIKLLEKLELDLKNIRHLSTAEAIAYIRRQVGYDQYIESYCLDKRISSNGLYEILDELEETAVKYPNHQDFMKHVEDFKIKIKNSKQRSPGKNEVNLLTMHSAKGLEFKVVIVIGVVEGIIPHSKSMDSSSSLEEERRLFYVAITRAKELLYVSSPQFRYDKKAEISRFVNEMQYRGPFKGELAIGKSINHRTFGKGFIEGISEKMLKIRFTRNDQIKDLDIETCLKNNILQK